MSRQPESELLMTSGNYELRFTPNLTRIFVRNTETGDTSFPRVAISGRCSGGPDNIYYPNDITPPKPIHRQVARILKARAEKPFSFGWLKFRKKLEQKLEII